MEFRSLYTLQTAEGVPIRVELAGLASRVFAYMIDALLMLTALGLVMLMFSLPPLSTDLADFGRTAGPIAMFLVFFGFHLVQEWRLNGRTIGKMLFHIRVVRQNGQPIGFWEAFGRNVLRLVDVYLSGIGLIVMMCSPHEKRLGDYLVGTLVINDEPAAPPHRPPLPEAEAPASAAFEPLLLSPEEADLIRQFLVARNTWQAEARQELSDALCRYLSERLHRPITGEADLEDLERQYRAL